MVDSKDLRDLTALWKERSEKEYDWVKKVISAVSIILGVIISLKKSDQLTEIHSIIFIVTILLNGFCILSGLIFLYGESDIIHRLATDFAEHIESPASGKEVFIQARPRKIFSILRVTFFILLILSIISLLTYATYTEWLMLIC